MTAEADDQREGMTAEEFTAWWFGVRGMEPPGPDDEVRDYFRREVKRCGCDDYPFPHWIMELTVPGLEAGRE